MVNVSSNQTSLQHFPGGIVFALLLPLPRAVIILYSSQAFLQTPAKLAIFFPLFIEKLARQVFRYLSLYSP